MKTRCFIFISVLLLVLLPVFSQNVGAQEWDKEYPEIESIYNIQVLDEMEDGYVYASLGKRNQMVLLKVKKGDGEIIWRQEYRITGYTDPYKIFPLSEKKLLIVGSARDDNLLLITDSLGNEIKRKIWKPEGYKLSGLTEAVENGDSTYTAKGFLENNYSGWYFSLVKFSQNLEIIWERTYLPETGDVYVTTIAKDGNGYIALGNIRGSYNNQQSGIIKFNENGEIMWQKTYPEPEHSFIAGNGKITKCSSGYLACSCSFQDGPDGAALMKIDWQGNIVCFNNNILNDANYAYAWMINCWEVHNKYVGVIIAQPYSYPYDVYPETYIIKTDTLGNLIYKRKWDKPNACAAILTQDNALLIAGGANDIPWAFKVAVPESANIEISPSVDLPSNINLKQNFPNPFNLMTTIEYQISEKTDVKIIVYDIAGKTVKTFPRKFQEPGVYTLVWDGKNNNGGFVSSGVYIYQLTTGQKTVCKKMVLEK